MSRRSRWPLAYVAGLLLVAGTLFISGLEDDTQADVTVAATTSAIPDLVGIWAGSWQDTIYWVSGDMAFEISQDDQTLNATGTIDLTALFMGVEVGTATGTLTRSFSASTLDFTFEAATVGNGSGTITDNSGSGTGTVTPPLSYGDFTFTGSVTEEEINGTFDFTSPTGGAGRAILARQTATEPTTLGTIKALYDVD